MTSVGRIDERVPVHCREHSAHHPIPKVSEHIAGAVSHPSRGSVDFVIGRWPLSLLEEARIDCVLAHLHQFELATVRMTRIH